MGKRMFIGAIIIIAVVILIVLALVLGVLNIGQFISLMGTDETENMSPENVGVPGTISQRKFSDSDIHMVICLLTDKDLPYTEHLFFIQGLHMEMYGIDDTTGFLVVNEYRVKNSADGYSGHDDSVERGTGWTAYLDFWWNDYLQGRGTMIADGSSVKGVSGSDVIVITSYGPITDYNDYQVWLSSH